MNEIIASAVDSEMDNLIRDLQRLIRQPSVSAKNQGITECATLVADIMSDAGIDSQILYLDRGVGDDRPGFNSKAKVWKEAEGKAYFVDPPNLDKTNTGKLKVSFLVRFMAPTILLR